MSGEETALGDPTAAQCQQKIIRLEPGSLCWRVVGEQMLKQESQAGVRGYQAVEQVAPQACAGSSHEGFENQVLSSLVLIPEPV